MTTKPESPDSGASGCQCQNCGEVYYADLVVPDDVWAAISPDCNLLCASCIAERIVREGIWTAIRGTDIDAVESAGDQAVAYASPKALNTFVLDRINGHRITVDNMASHQRGDYTVPLYTRAQDAAGKGVTLDDACRVIEELLPNGAEKPRWLTNGKLRDAMNRAAKPAQVWQKDAIGGTAYDRADRTDTEIMEMTGQCPRCGNAAPDGVCYICDYDSQGRAIGDGR